MQTQSPWASSADPPMMGGPSSANGKCTNTHKEDRFSRLQAQATKQQRSPIQHEGPSLAYKFTRASPSSPLPAGSLTVRQQYAVEHRLFQLRCPRYPISIISIFRPSSPSFCDHELKAQSSNCVSLEPNFEDSLGCVGCVIPCCMYAVYA